MPFLELAYLLVLATLWGASYTLIKIAVQTIPPFTIVAARVTLAAAILALVARWQGCRVPRSRRFWAGCLVQAALLNAIPFSLISWGEQFIDSGLAGILNATPPLFTFVLRRQWARRQLLGVVLGTSGVVLVIGAGALAGVGQHSLPEVAVLAASACYALAAIWGHRLAAHPPLSTTVATLTWSAVITAPISLLIDQPWHLRPSAASLGALAALAVFSTALATLVYFRLLRTLGSLGTTSNSYLRAAASVGLGMLVLGERPSVSSTAGLILVVAGVATLLGAPRNAAVRCADGRPVLRPRRQQRAAAGGDDR